MKTFITSIITFFIILSSILVFMFFLKSSIDDFTQISDDIISSAESENWSECEKITEKLKNTWKEKRSFYEAFISHKETDLIGEMIEEIDLYTKFNEKKYVVLMATRLKIQFLYLYDDEMPTIENIV